MIDRLQLALLLRDKSKALFIFLQQDLLLVDYGFHLPDSNG